MKQENLKEIIELSERALAKNELEFIDELEFLLPRYEEVLKLVSEDRKFIEDNRKDLEVFQELHSNILTKAQSVMDKRKELTLKQISTAKGLKAYIDKYPRRISAFGKRKG